MTDLQLALELLTAFLGGFFVACFAIAMYVKRRPRPVAAAVLTLFDHDGVPVTVQPVHAEHWLRKGFHREWITPAEVSDASNLPRV